MAALGKEFRDNLMDGAPNVYNLAVADAGMGPVDVLARRPEFSDARSADHTEPALDPEHWAVARFRECPAALLVAHDENLDEYTRDLQLIGDRLGEPSFQRLAAVLGGYVAHHSANWAPARIIAREAVRDGRELVDFDVLADKNIRESIGFLRNLIGGAEALSRGGERR